jgi:hypothetical protein
MFFFAWKLRFGKTNLAGNCDLCQMRFPDFKKPVGFDGTGLGKWWVANYDRLISRIAPIFGTLLTRGVLTTAMPGAHVQHLGC